MNKESELSFSLSTWVKVLRAHSIGDHFSLEVEGSEVIDFR